MNEEQCAVFPCSSWRGFDIFSIWYNAGPSFHVCPCLLRYSPSILYFFRFCVFFFFIMKELSAQKHSSHLTRVKRQFILFFLEYNVLHSELHNVSGHGLEIQTQFILNNVFQHGNSNRTEKVINQSTFQINCEKC